MTRCHAATLLQIPVDFTRSLRAYESLLVIIFVGIVAGWLAGRVMEGGGFGLIGDLIVGLIGAFIGDWLLPQLGVHFGTGIVALIINAFIGAVILLFGSLAVGRGAKSSSRIAARTAGAHCREQ
jgi:uncharacterized membrane protein YeaQ/YmgE (transglycosylase-associated protein family)